MGNYITQKDYRVHYYEVDFEKRALISSILNYFNDTAMYQSELVNRGMDYMIKNNVGWVIYKWHIKLNKYPQYSDVITVRTWPKSFKKIFAYRQFDILDKDKKTIASADSMWILFDTKNRKPKKLDKVCLDAYHIDESDKKALDMPKLVQPEREDAAKSFKVRFSDIDTNRHVNNVKYISWCIETLPLEIAAKYSLVDLSVEYERETSYGETIRVTTQIDKKDDGSIECLHKITDKEGKKLTLLKTIWTPND